MRGGVKDHRVLLHFRSSGSKGQYVLILLDIAKLLCLETAAAAAVAAAKSLQSCLTLCDPIDCSPPGSPIPGDSPGKNTGVGRHFFLQCMKVKSESEVAQSCPTLCDPMDCSLPGFSVHGIFQARILEWAAITFSGLETARLCNSSSSL